jgi:uncharacterized SAM-binding protein YcdF (DUF218 family)
MLGCPPANLRVSDVFVFSKIFWWFFEPSNLILLVLLVGVALLWSRRRRILGRWLVSLVALVFLFLSTVPFDALLIAPLENRFPPVRELPRDVVGVITLGGAVDQFSTRARNSISLNDHSERLTEFVALARRYPGLKLVYTGGSASLTRPDIKETLVARRLFDSLGVAPGRVIYEDQSRNTRENAVFTHRLIAPPAGQKWLLITSAFHMPRAVGVFRKAGWTIVPYPVSYITYDGDYSFWRAPLGALRNLSAGVHEWIGLVAYRLMGWSDSLFPGPAPGLANGSAKQ